MNDENYPTAALIITSECNLLIGTTSDNEFNSSLKDIDDIDFWDPLTPDTDEWAEIIPDVHKNKFIRKYTRRNYILKKDDYQSHPITIPDEYVLGKAIPDDLKEKSYINSAKLLSEISKWGSDQNYMAVSTIFEKKIPLSVGQWWIATMKAKWKLVYILKKDTEKWVLARLQ